MNCCTSVPRVYDPSKPPWMQQPVTWAPQVSTDSRGLPTIRPLRCKKEKTRDDDHLQNSARLGVFKIRVADTFLSTDRGTHLYWRDTALGALNCAQLPVGAYTGVRLATTKSSGASFRAVRATPREPPPRSRRASTTCWARLRERGTADLQLRGHGPLCRALAANAAERVGPLGHDIIAKIICNQESDTHEKHLINVRGPVTLRYMRFKLTDVNGKTVNLRGTSISFCIYLDG